MILDVLQWVAAGFILVGYICYAKKLIWGPILSAIGSGGFIVWAVYIPAHGIATLNIVLMAINIWALHKWKNEQTNSTS